MPHEDDSSRTLPAIVGPLVTPPDMLRRFRQSQTDAMPMLRRLELDWPSSLAIMHRLAEYLTNVLVYERGHSGLRPGGPPVPVLFLCLQKGLEAYDAAADEADDHRLLAFADGAFDEAAGHLCGVALFKPDNDCWMAGQGVPLNAWIAPELPKGISVHRSHRRGASHERIIAAVSDYAVPLRERRIIDTARQSRRHDARGRQGAVP